MPKNITIYTTNTCSYCVMVKKWLDAKAFTYDVINLDEQPEKRQEAFDVSGGASTVPVTVVTKQDDTTDVIIGWNLAKLAPAVAS